jgi:hypothetical protein
LEIGQRFDTPNPCILGLMRLNFLSVVKKENLPVVRKQLKNYERMKLLMERWIDLATELSNLRLVKEID